MTPLRQRMLEDMQLRGLSARTQGGYVAAVRHLAEHFHTSPAQLTEEQLHQYFLYVANEKQVARTSASGDRPLRRLTAPLSRADTRERTPIATLVPGFRPTQD
ncbi:MAG: phage integrase N-terminal SAM-like domain-containing protein, partial [bacterium]